ncbi:response regulator transcription factor [Rheinheimera pleomorphica]|uniref:response regulator transcription factor n=1 Tax=Rheinheimera pleomorphica TaxID=2703963 RepID=UPI00142077FF|nr:response regulator transcription factor [Rheinheimera pleomorphica]
MKELSVLVIESCHQLGRELCDYLLQAGMQVDFAATGTLGLKLARAISFDVIVINVMLTGSKGADLCSTLKQQCDPIPPVLLMSDRDCLTEKRQGFAAGADDFMSRPYCLEELGLRCKALSRRHKLHQPQTISIGELKINENRRVVVRADKKLRLSNTDFEILMMLAQAYPNAVSRQQLANKIWAGRYCDSDVIRSHIYTLRRELDKPFATPMLKTLHRQGYRLESTASHYNDIHTDNVSLALRHR